MTTDKGGVHLILRRHWPEKLGCARSSTSDSWSLDPRLGEFAGQAPRAAFESTTPMATGTSPCSTAGAGSHPRKDRKILFLGSIVYMSSTPTKSTKRATATGRAEARSSAADDPLATSRVRVLVDAFGGARLAKLLGVSASQPTRWVKGQERPGVAAAPLLIDLEHVLAKTRLIWGEEAAKQWLRSPNSYLEGARPLDVLHHRGPSAVLDALEAEMWGGAA
jgi:hypothetical protein